MFLTKSQIYQKEYRAKKLAQDPNYFKKCHEKSKQKSQVSKGLPGKSLIGD